MHLFLYSTIALCAQNELANLGQRDTGNRMLKNVLAKNKLPPSGSGREAARLLRFVQREASLARRKLAASRQLTSEDNQDIVALGQAIGEERKTFNQIFQKQFPLLQVAGNDGGLSLEEKELIARVVTEDCTVAVDVFNKAIDVYLIVYSLPNIWGFWLLGSLKDWGLGLMLGAIPTSFLAYHSYNAYKHFEVGQDCKEVWNPKFFYPRVVNGDNKLVDQIVFGLVTANSVVTIFIAARWVMKLASFMGKLAYLIMLPPLVQLMYDSIAFQQLMEKYSDSLKEKVEEVKEKVQEVIDDM